MRFFTRTKNKKFMTRSPYKPFDFLFKGSVRGYGLISFIDWSYPALLNLVPLTKCNSFNDV